jgi:hypothetical protein
VQVVLGTHRPHWLRLVDVPLFVSHRTLRTYRTLPRAVGPWALDSGGFTELNMHGRWATTTSDYLDAVGRYQANVGLLEWAAPQDWMCEPVVLAKTGLPVREHQERTVQNYLDLRGRPFIPVLQGWTVGDYWRCVDLYSDAGVDLRDEPLVGLGTVCRRQGTSEIAGLVRDLAGGGLRLHGFGMKLGAFDTDVAVHLVSADSLAWSYGARRSPPLPGCTHRSCANCLRWALAWRERVLARIDEPKQLGMTLTSRQMAS